jgi:hypothetical protein
MMTLDVEPQEVETVIDVRDLCLLHREGQFQRLGGCAAVRFHKQGGDDAVYDLYLSTYGWQCQCKGAGARGEVR